MPYIIPEHRIELDPYIDNILNKINSMGFSDKTYFAGLLNYLCTKLALGLIPEKQYWAIAATTGALRNSAEEFYRRVAVPFEEEKMKKNGDVY